MRRVVLVGVSIFLMTCLLAGCGEPTTKPSYRPTNVKEFTAVNEGEVTRFYFLLEDQNGNNAVGDGQADIQIKDSGGKVVFTQAFHFRSSDFVDYEFKLTGQKIGKTYEWRVNQADIKKGVSDTGTAYLTLTMADGNVLNSTDNYVQIPSYTEEEIKQMYEEQYLRNSTSLDETFIIEDVEFNIERMGSFAFLEYGNEKTYYRIDLEVKNLGLSKLTISSYEIKIIDSAGNQYDWEYGSTLELGDLSPNSTKKGYVLFKNPAGAVKILEIGKYYYNFIEKKGYTLEQMYEEQYDRNAKVSGAALTKGNFEVTLVKYGFYTHLEYDTWGDEVTDFRVDLAVKNIGSEEDSFLTYDAVVISGSSQYQRSYRSESELDSSDIYPGIVRQGYLVFEDVPKTLTGEIRIVAGTSYDASYNKLTYEFNVQI